MPSEDFYSWARHFESDVSSIFHSLPDSWFFEVWGRFSIAWWRHQMETFSALLAICAGKSPVPGEFPAQKPVTRSFDVFFYLRRNKQLSKQWWGWWFETPSWSLWRHRNGIKRLIVRSRKVPQERDRWLKLPICAEIGQASRQHG